MTSESAPPNETKENAGGRIAKNASVLMSSQVITWALSLVLTIFLPRYLGPELIGKLHLATSLWAIITVLVSFGMDLLLMKEIARRPDDTGVLVTTSLIMRLGLFVIGSMIMLGWVSIAGYPLDTVYVIGMLGVNFFFVQFSAPVRASFTGLERMDRIAYADIGHKAFSAVVIIILLLFGASIYPIIGAMIVASLLKTILMYMMLRSLQPLRLGFSFKAGIDMLRNGSPFMFGTIFRTIYVQVDVIIIAMFVNETVVGWYGQADRLFGTIQFIPTVLMTAIFPSLSRMFSEKSEKLPELMARSFSLLLVLSIPIGFGMLVLASNFTLLLFGEEFINSGPVLAVLGIVAILTYQNTLLGAFLMATDREKTIAIIMAIAAISTLPLDLVLVPWTQAQFANGAIGGALAFVVTEGVMMAVLLTMLPKGVLTRGTLWQTAKVLFAGLLMIGSIWFIRDLFVVIPIAVGGVVYIGAILLLRVIPEDELDMAKGLVGKIVRRIKRNKVEPAGI